MHTLYFVIGASGSGKTAAVCELERSSRAKMFYFDSIGMPSEQERAEKWGGGAGWQRAMTIEWARRIHPELAEAPAVLDGQTRPSFIAEACKLGGVDSWRVILVTRADDVRRARLLKRGQPELANDQMMQWARYLVAETRRIGGTIIDNDGLSVTETAAALARIVG
jgi:RNase adaptor protein for sRNA GlmZ degradation